MLFSSVPFLYYFLPCVLILYFIAPRCLKNTVLFISSLVFYGWGEPIYVLLMLVSVLVGYISGIVIEKTTVPMGVTAIIYESRPNVTSDAAALALKSGNVCVLRGGKEAFSSANAIVNAMRKGLNKLNLPETFINLVQDTTRESANELMNAVGFVDLLIPRGGAGLIKSVVSVIYL